MKNVKEILKNIASKQTNDSFTWWNSYNPEMPNFLKEQIKNEEDK